MRFKLLPVVCILPLVLSFTGCTLSPTGTPAPESGASLQGKVHGGQQPIVGAHVYLLAANTTGYGGNGIPASTSNASVSLLTSATGNSDAIGNYVLTDSNGNFAINGNYTCSGNQQLYLYALGGNPGAGTNPAAGLLTAVGTCPSAGTAAGSYYWMNEVTTIAAAYAFAGFASDPTHVSSAGTALAQVGIANAFVNAANLASSSLGITPTTTPAGNGTVPQTTIYTLANILATCINSTGAISGPVNATACYTLFYSAESGGSSGTVPTDTATAAINIAHNPGSNVATLYDSPPPASPFNPILTTQPNDFTIGISFAGGGLDYPADLAIDASGDVWVANTNGSGVTELASSGTFLSGTSGYPLTLAYGIAIDPFGSAWVTGANSAKLSSSGSLISSAQTFNNTFAFSSYIAIDGSGNVWTTDYKGRSAVEYPNSGTAITRTITPGTLAGIEAVAIDASGDLWITSGTPSVGVVTEISSSGQALSGAGTFPTPTGPGFGFASFGNPWSIAIDHSGNSWISDYAGNDLVKMSNSGTVVSPSGGFSGGAIGNPAGVSIDGAGNVWVANNANANGSVTELSNAGAVLSGTTGYMGGALNYCLSIAADGSGNVWVSNLGTNTITELIGVAAPVVTPLSVGVANNMLGARP